MRCGRGVPAAARALGAALLLAALLAGGTARAWGPVGHRAVGEVADALLRPGARAAVQDLLAADLLADSRPSGRHTLADVADWADEIRGGPYDEPRWHYDDRPVCGAPTPAGAWCARGDCATAQLPRLLAIVADARRTRAERNTALKWVVHLVGDLHQPLHAADLAEGGNRIRVRPPAQGHATGGRRREGESLHAFWDSQLVNLALHPQDGAIPPRALDRLLRRARAQDPAALATDPAVWAEESNAIARHFALDLDGVDCALEGRSGRDSHRAVTVRLSRDYVARGRRMVEDRLALAGARLAYLLNERLDPAPR